ncbi:MAG: hypothetical protein AAF430_16760 [Myxococcota bacterium]
MKRALAFLLCASGLATGGCLGAGVPADALPAQPIAIQYRTPEEARRRAESSAPAVDSVAAGTTRVGSKARLYTDLDALGAFFADRLGVASEPVREGRLALLHPRTGALELVEAARRGAVPQDWDAAHRRLLFAQPTPGSRDVQVYEYDRAEGSVRRITQGPALHTQACFWADGRIVVTRIETDRSAPVSRLQVSEPGGRGPFRDLTVGATDHSPSCADSQVAFVRVERGRSALFTVDLAGDERALGSGHQPRWVGSGPWLVYTAVRRGRPQLFRIRGDGSARARLGAAQRAEAWPTGSPDGRFVAYVSGEQPVRHQLYLRRFDGGGDRLLFDDGDADYPVW